MPSACLVSTGLPVGWKGGGDGGKKRDNIINQHSKKRKDMYE